MGSLQRYEKKQYKPTKTKTKNKKMKILKAIRKFIFKLRLRSAIKKANKLRRANGCKYFVFKDKGEILIIRKQRIKALIASGRITANIHEIEKIALYTTE
jgi:hypothetical protein